MNQDAKAWLELCSIGFSARITYIGVRCGLFGSFTSSFIQFLLLYTQLLHHSYCLLSTLQYSILHYVRYSVVELGRIVIRNGNLECKCSRHCNSQIVHSVWLWCTIRCTRIWPNSYSNLKLALSFNWILQLTKQSQMRSIFDLFLFFNNYRTVNLNIIDTSPNGSSLFRGESEFMISLILESSFKLLTKNDV